MSRSLQIVGAGLLGTSVGLALAALGVDGLDRRRRRASPAAGRRPGSGDRWGGRRSILTSCCSVSRRPRSAKVMSGGDSSISLSRRLVMYPALRLNLNCKPRNWAAQSGLSGGHPMAGRERSGAVAAQADLFDARPWAICPSGVADPARVAIVEQLARDCGADPLIVDAESHDAAVALVSHLPQIAASAVAGQLGDAAPARDDAGRAGSARHRAHRRERPAPVGRHPDRQRWLRWRPSSAGSLPSWAKSLRRSLPWPTGMPAGPATMLAADRDVDKTIKRFLDQGRRGFERIPGKHGAPATAYTVIPVVIPDEPGALARLFATVAKAGASVEDIAPRALTRPPGGNRRALGATGGRGPIWWKCCIADGWSSH